MAVLAVAPGRRFLRPVPVRFPAVRRSHGRRRLRRPGPGRPAGRQHFDGRRRLETPGCSWSKTWSPWSRPGTTLHRWSPPPSTSAASRFGARAGFVCLPTGPGGRRGRGWRGLDRDRLGAASRHPGLHRLVSGSGLAVVAPTDPIVAQLTAGAEFAIALPLDRRANRAPSSCWCPRSRTPAGAGHWRRCGRWPSAGLRAAQAAAAGEAAGLPLASLVHSLADPVLSVDAAGRFPALNAAAAELFALSDSFELGRPPGVGSATRAWRGCSSRTTGRMFPAEAARRSSWAGPPPAGSCRRRGPWARRRPGSHAPPGPCGHAVRAGDRRGGGRARPGAARPAGHHHHPGRRSAGVARPPADWEIARKGILAEAARLDAVADQLALLSPRTRRGRRPSPCGPSPCDVVGIAGRGRARPCRRPAARSVTMTAARPARGPGGPPSPRTGARAAARQRPPLLRRPGHGRDRRPGRDVRGRRGRHRPGDLLRRHPRSLRAVPPSRRLARPARRRDRPLHLPPARRAAWAAGSGATAGSGSAAASPSACRVLARRPPARRAPPRRPVRLPAGPAVGRSGCLRQMSGRDTDHLCPPGRAGR